MKKKLSLFIAIIMAATVMYIPAGVYAEDTPVKEVSDIGEISYEEGPDGAGFINIEGRTVKLKDPVDANTASQKLKRYGSSVSVAKYDPRTSYSVAVKDQGSTGLCWAFSMTTAAERDYYKEKNSYIELSPGHLGYFFYHRVNDPLGNTSGDTNVTDYDWKTIGSNQMLASQALAGWTGFASESLAPFSAVGSGYSSDIAYDNSVILQTAEFLDELPEVKESIVENGAVVIAYHAPIDASEDAAFYNETTYGYYCSDSSYEPNHAVTIVGWDDNYPAENFVETPLDDNGDPINGAWLVQNSWSEYYGDDGYFYLSYADTTTCNYTSVDVTGADEYDYNYQYDGNAYPGQMEFYEGEKTANVYTVEDTDNQLLEAVSFTSWDSEYVSYTVDIYTDLADPSDPLSGTKASSFDVSTDNWGVYTFRLDECGEEPVYLEPGTDYSIVITPDSYTVLGVEADFDTQSVFDFNATISEGQSFWYDNSGDVWYDCADGSFCTRIKGLVSIAEGDYKVNPTSISVDGVKASSTVTVPYGTDKSFTVNFTPSDTTEKSIKWTSSAPNIAEVDENGVLNTYDIGTTKITAETVNGKKFTFNVKVTVPNLKAPSTISVNLYGYNDYIVSWSEVPGATGYYLDYKRSSWKKWKSLGSRAAAQRQVANQTNGAKYAFRVCPFIKINGKVYKGTSYKTSSYVYTLKKLNTPSVKKASKYYVKVTWNNIYGESGYEIARSTKKSSGYTTIKTLNYKYKTTKIKTTRNKKYYYKVRAYKTVNGQKIYGPWSNARTYKLR